MLLALLLVTSGFRFRGIGDFYLGEIYSSIFFIFHVVSKKRSRYIHTSFPKWVKNCLLLWLAFVTFSSLFAKSSSSSLVKFLLTVFISFTLLYSFFIVFESSDKLGRNLRFLLIGQVLAAFVQPYNLGVSNGWKFQYGLPLSVLIISFLIDKSKTLGILSAFVLSFISFNLSARNLAISITLCAFIGFLQELTKHRKVILGTRFNVVLLLALVALSSISYFTLAKSGSLGAKEQLRLEKLLNSQQFFVSSRPEIFFTVKTLMNSPILGYGSSLEVDQTFLRQIATAARDNGLVFQGLEKTAYNIPVHSYIMDAMLKGGIPAGFFWFWCFVMGLNFMVRNLFVLNPAETILVTSLIWNIWFSPYGASSRILSMFAVFYIIHFSRKYSKVNHS